jgi:hypothetical protein
MMKPCRPLALAAVVGLTIGVGVGAAQTVEVTNAPAGSTVELVLNNATIGSAAADAAGFATIPVNLQAHGGKRETDVYVHIDSCESSRRIIIAERGQQPPPAGANCERRDMGLFLLRRVSTVVVNLGGVNPTVLLVQGRFDPRNPRPMRAWNAAPTGFVFSAGGGLMKFSDVELVSCGNVAGCSGGGFEGGYTAAVTYWIKPFLGADVAFVKPAEAEVTGGGTGFQFTSNLDSRVLTVAGKSGAPLGPVRIYGTVGGTFQQSTFTTTQHNDDSTVTINNVTQIIEGGTQTFELKTEGWAWMFGGGVELWLKRWLAAYAEVGFLKLKGSPVDNAEGELNDRVMSIVLGARVHIGR